MKTIIQKRSKTFSGKTRFCIFVMIEGNFAHLYIKVKFILGNSLHTDVKTALNLLMNKLERLIVFEFI